MNTDKAYLRYVLNCMAEECGEATQDVCKMLRVGESNYVPYKPGSPKYDGQTYAQRLEQELVDITALAEMLEAEGLITKGWRSRKRRTEKKARVDKWMTHDFWYRRRKKTAKTKKT